MTSPTAGEIEAYYLGQKDRINKPFDQVKPQLEQALLQARQQEARDLYMERLRKGANTAVLLQKPKLELAVDPARVKGNPDAPVTIVEFSDFECPFCQAAEPTVKQVMEKYGDRVRLAYRDLPLRQIHPQAQQAAEASRCAAEQGKFWEYHDLLFAGQLLDEQNLKKDAEKAGMNVEAYEACYKSGKYRPMIDNDLQTGMKSGVTGTPAFFINGQLIGGNQPITAFEQIIDAELARHEGKTVAQTAAR